MDARVKPEQGWRRERESLNILHLSGNSHNYSFKLYKFWHRIREIHDRKSYRDRIKSWARRNWYHSRGSLITEFFTTPKDRRLAKYLEAFDELVQKVEVNHEIDSSTLAKRDDFLDMLYGTISLWIVTSNSDKQNAIIELLENVAIEPSADEAKDSIVLRLLRDLSGSHLHIILKYRKNPDFCASTSFREMLGPESWDSDWGIIHNDLHNLGILTAGRLTALGKYFLDKITVK